MKNPVSWSRLIAVMLLTLFFNTQIFSQNNSQTFDVGVRGVFDRVTEKELTGADYKLVDVRNDSVIRKGKALAQSTNNGQVVERSFFKIKNIPVGLTYNLIITYPGYEESINEIDGTNLESRQYRLIVDNIFLDRKARELDEVQVKTTKVKFYNRGDTLVYNAEAFVMAEGSMLDDIIRQLPGVELKDNGQILVNGKFVENLLLNGKDFFKDNREIMLRNLAAYTVKNIEVYERQEDIDRLLGDDFGQKVLTMDVKLKRDFNHNYMGNIEAGYGTRNRYLGRLFGMWNSDHARISLIGNINNLNETRKPGMEQSFSPDALPSGTLKTYMGGVEYNVESKKSGWVANGDAVVKRTVLDDGTRTYTTSYLPSGDTYARSFDSKLNRNFSVSTSHKFQTTGKWHFIGIHPSVAYNKSDLRNRIDRIVFDKDIQHITASMIRDIFDGTHTAALGSMINRELRDKSDNGHSLHLQLWSDGRFRLKTGMLQTISYLVSASYEDRYSNGSEWFGINIGNNINYADASDRYLRNHPDYGYKLKGAIGYQARPSRNMALDIYYEYLHNETKATSDLFNVMQPGTVSEETVVGYLASYGEYIRTFDQALSYIDRRHQDLHTLSPNVMGRLGKMEFNVKGDICIDRQSIDYYRDARNYVMSRTTFRPGNMELTLRFPLGKAEKFKSQFAYRLTPQTPDLLNMIDVTDRRDPLNIYIGNPDLKNSSRHLFRWIVNSNNPGSGLSQSYMVSANFYCNMLASVYDFNKSTGIKTIWHQNVNGNMDAGIMQQLHLETKAMRGFFFENTTRINYIHSVDYMSENGGASFRNTVNTLGAGEELKGGFNKTGNKVEAFIKADLQHYSSRMDNFSSFNAANLNYGVRGIVKLPANFQIATDFTIYSRRGYNDSQLNTDNFVWNARLSYSIPNLGLTLMADGYDILHNLTNVSYRINAQARTEIYHTVLPRYFLLHLQWTFNKKPHRKS